jgi:hypothetical protein
VPTRTPDDEAPGAPAIPSFASLRSPHRRSALDALVPGSAAEPDPTPVPAPEPPVPAAPRPAEYADLLHFGARVARSAADASWRLARWSAGAPVRCLRRALGG